MTDELVNRVDVGGVGENKISESTSSVEPIANFGEAEDSIDAQELAALLEQTGGTESGCAQIVDGDGNLITLTAEQLSAAGIDIANLGESDVETLLQLAQGAHVTAQRDDNLHSEHGESDVLGAGVGKLGSSSAPAKKRSIDFDEEVQNAPKKRKFSPANVATSSSQVTAETEDITELDEQTLASLVQSGSVKFVDEDGNEIPASAVLVSGTQVIQSNINKGDGGLAPKMGRPAIGGAPILKPQHYSTYSIVGTEVDVKRGNRLVPATIRYIRPGVGYKVQFDDGRFEWVSESDVTPRSAASSSSTVGMVPQSTSANDEGQSSGAAGQSDDAYLTLDDNELDDLDDDVTAFRAPAPPSLATGSRPPRSRGRPPSNGVISTYAGRRSAFHHHHSAASSGSGYTPSGRLGHGYSNRSGVKSPPSSTLSRHQSTCGAANSGAGGGETNFICPVCERKVYNKEPSYIVIRLPACDECAESKILVLDEQTK